MIHFIIFALVVYVLFRAAVRSSRQRRYEEYVASRLVAHRSPGAVFYSPDWEWEKYDADRADPAKLFAPPQPSGPRQPKPQSAHPEAVAWHAEQERLDDVDRRGSRR